MPDEWTVTPSDESLDDIPIEDIESSDLHCEVCGVALTYGGRGRKPKFCSEHRKSGNKSSSGGSSGSSSTAKIERMMTERYIELAKIIMLISPEDAMVIADKAPILGEQWATLAESNPKVKRILTKTSNGAGWAGVIFSHTVLALSIMDNHHYTPGFIRVLQEKVSGGRVPNPTME